jgi:polar amino acid transport system substrate-binding protein
MTEPTAAARADLVPTGTLRAGINFGNLILVRRVAGGEPRGVSIDLTRELARRLRAPYEVVEYPTIIAQVDAAPSGAWDVAFLGSDPARENVMSFTQAYLEIEASYLVPAGSPLRAAAEVDREGVRVAAPTRANYELYLRRHLKKATLVSAADADAAFALLTTGKVEAYAGLTQALAGLAGKLPGSRIVEGRFMAVQQSMAVPRGREAGLAYLRGFLEEAKASGLVARAIEQTGARGVSVAPRLS